MKKLHTFGLWERPQAGLLKELLEKEGIACLLRNNDLVSVMGEIPLVECFPELWVLDDETWPRAKSLLDQWLSGDEEQSVSWSCPNCGEVLEGVFGACWQCGHRREQP